MQTYRHKKRVTEKPFPRIFGIKDLSGIETEWPVIPVESELIIDELIACPGK
jgi:hypothetical protein